MVPVCFRINDNAQSSSENSQKPHLSAHSVILLLLQIPNVKGSEQEKEVHLALCSKIWERALKLMFSIMLKCNVNCGIFSTAGQDSSFGKDRWILMHLNSHMQINKGKFLHKFAALGCIRRFFLRHTLFVFVTLVPMPANWNKAQ